MVTWIVESNSGGEEEGCGVDAEINQFSGLCAVEELTNCPPGT